MASSAISITIRAVDRPLVEPSRTPITRCYSPSVAMGYHSRDAWGIALRDLPRFARYHLVATAFMAG